MRIDKVCLMGGTGFIGQHLAARLARLGCRIRVLTRRRERHRELLVLPRLELVETNVHFVSNLSAQFDGCDAVINLIGILNEDDRDEEHFKSAHAELPAKVAEACRYHHIKRLLHMSALGAALDAPSEYLRTKAEGENAVHAAGRDGLSVTSFRPSVIFGPGDSFFNRFATLLSLAPGVFPLACPDARFAPVYVADLVEALVKALHHKPSQDQRYDLCGPGEYTLRELVEYTASVLGMRRAVIGLNDSMSRWQARALELVPGKPFSRDNYQSMQVASVCAEENGFARFDIVPRSIESIVPGYLGRGPGLYSRFRSQARRP